MEEGQTAANESPYRWPRYAAADTGFRHYWYPAVRSKDLKKAPLPVKLLGEKIFLIRDGSKVRALHDRCPHRGVRLSAGRQQFPGTISCVYHGWTYDVATGKLVGALTDGPNSPICGKAVVNVKTYPVEERAGIVWLYMGDEPRPLVEEDIPDEFLLPDAVVEPLVEIRKGNWRYAMENAVDEAHTRYLHRETPFVFFRTIPGYQTDCQMVPSEDGKWIRRSSKPVFGQHDYPGLGKWPRSAFWRRAGRHVIVGMARLPAIFYVGHKNWHDYQIFTPVDEDHHLMWQIAVRRTSGLGVLWWKLRVHTYIRLLHRIMLNRWEDAFIVEEMDCPPERLFRPDVFVVAWRRHCDATARRSPAVANKDVEPGRATAAPADLNEFPDAEPQRAAEAVSQ
jgi:phenylpropionate dioxygenase-like ring-hydroxylating dioxygenase large terminal subunit